MRDRELESCFRAQDQEVECAVLDGSIFYSCRSSHLEITSLMVIDPLGPGGAGRYRCDPNTPKAVSRFYLGQKSLQLPMLQQRRLPGEVKGRLLAAGSPPTVRRNSGDLSVVC